MGAPLNELLRLEPEFDFVVGGFNWVGTVDDVSADVDTEVTTDGAWCWVEWLGGTEHLSAGENSVVSFPDHAGNGAWGGVGNESFEERLAGEISVVLLELLSTWGGELQSNELETLSLEASYDLTNKTTLDAIGLDHDESAFAGFFLNHS